ncbi:MAG: ABC transporter ATP-binding protein, partial [Roseicyclus sp.]
APIYTLQLLADATMLTVRCGRALVSVNAPKEFRAEIGDPFAAAVPARICHIFDAGTGQRI